MFLDWNGCASSEKNDFHGRGEHEGNQNEGDAETQSALGYSKDLDFDNLSISLVNQINYNEKKY